ncbi:hypothetical protein SLOPH_2219, partial [Spraguea lophii 42_110]
MDFIYKKYSLYTSLSLPKISSTIKKKLSILNTIKNIKNENIDIFLDKLQREDMDSFKNELVDSILKNLKLENMNKLILIYTILLKEYDNFEDIFAKQFKKYLMERNVNYFVLYVEILIIKSVVKEEKVDIIDKIMSKSTNEFKVELMEELSKNCMLIKEIENTIGKSNDKEYVVYLKNLKSLFLKLKEICLVYANSIKDDTTLEYQEKLNIVKERVRNVKSDEKGYVEVEDVYKKKFIPTNVRIEVNEKNVKQTIVDTLNFLVEEEKIGENACKSKRFGKNTIEGKFKTFRKNEDKKQNILRKNILNKETIIKIDKLSNGIRKIPNINIILKEIVDITNIYALSRLLNNLKSIKIDIKSILNDIKNENVIIIYTELYKYGSVTQKELLKLFYFLVDKMDILKINIILESVGTYIKEIQEKVEHIIDCIQETINKHIDLHDKGLESQKKFDEKIEYLTDKIIMLRNTLYKINDKNCTSKNFSVIIKRLFLLIAEEKTDLIFKKYKKLFDLLLNNKPIIILYILQLTDTDIDLYFKLIYNLRIEDVISKILFKCIIISLKMEENHKAYLYSRLYSQILFNNYTEKRTATPFSLINERIISIIINLDDVNHHCKI